MDNYTSPKEREYQNEIVKLFREELHYNYLGKLQYGKNRQTMDNGVKNSPVIESELRSFLSREGSSYTDFQNWKRFAWLRMRRDFRIRRSGY